MSEKAKPWAVVDGPEWGYFIVAEARKEILGRDTEDERCVVEAEYIRRIESLPVLEEDAVSLKARCNRLIDDLSNVRSDNEHLANLVVHQGQVIKDSIIALREAGITGDDEDISVDLAGCIKVIAQQRDDYRHQATPIFPSAEQKTEPPKPIFKVNDLVRDMERRIGIICDVMDSNQLYEVEWLNLLAGDKRCRWRFDRAHAKLTRICTCTDYGKDMDPNELPF